jgi:hypothetical protein
VTNSRPLRTALTIAMDVLIALAIVETVRLVVLFFGRFTAAGWGKAIIALTNPLTIPFGVDPIKTPYGGVFAVDVVLTIVVLLLAEWVLSVVRSRA